MTKGINGVIFGDKDISISILFKKRIFTAIMLFLSFFLHLGGLLAVMAYQYGSNDMQLSEFREIVLDQLNLELLISFLVTYLIAIVFHTVLVLITNFLTRFFFNILVIDFVQQIVTYLYMGMFIFAVLIDNFQFKAIIFLMGAIWFLTDSITLHKGRLSIKINPIENNIFLEIYYYLLPFIKSKEVFLGYPGSNNHYQIKVQKYYKPKITELNKKVNADYGRLYKDMAFTELIEEIGNRNLRQKYNVILMVYKDKNAVNKPVGASIGVFQETNELKVFLDSISSYLSIVYVPTNHPLLRV